MEHEASEPQEDRPQSGAVVALRGRVPVMADVARRAGVSNQTVSRVLHRHASVAPTTRARVEAAIAELGYRPNSVARALVTGRTRTIGVVTAETALYGPAATLAGIQQAARAAGYEVSIDSIGSVAPASVLSAVERLALRNVDGIVLLSPFESGRDSVAHLHCDVPLVAMDRLDGALPAVVYDEEAGARAAVEHLLALGHRTVWHVAGPADWVPARDRTAGWRTALEAGGAPVPPFAAGDWSAASGFEAGRQLAALTDVTAIFAANDLMALGVIRALHAAGRRVPDDVSVVGYDDMPEAPFFEPPLTTVRQDFGELGRRGVEVLLAHLGDGGPEPGTQAVETELVIRESTAAPR